MNWFTGVLVYSIVWCVVFLTVLPFGVRRVETPEEGHDHGAPVQPMLWRKAAATTAIVCCSPKMATCLSPRATGRSSTPRRI